LRGGAMGRMANSVVEKFWCNWQMRHSPHPVLALVAGDVGCD
jgi:hypothetical protein